MGNLQEGNILRGIKKILLIFILILVVFLGYKIYIKADTIKLLIANNPLTMQSINEINIEEKEEEMTEGYHYYYNQLDKNGKIIYKGIENNIENLKTGTYEIDYGMQFNDLLETEGGAETLNRAFQSAWNAFTYDHVETFYIDVTKLILTTQTTSIANLTTHRVFLGKGKEENNTSYLIKEFDNGTDLESTEEELETLRSKIAKILDGYSDYEKVRYVHDWMIDNLEYDTTYEGENIYNIYGALKRGSTVCEGYARTFKYLLDKLQIPCVLVSGIATNSEGETESHAWNYVELEGKWYAVDVTWDDPIIENGEFLSLEARYKNFLKGSDEFFKNHKEDGDFSENSIQFVFPIIEKQNY